MAPGEQVSMCSKGLGADYAIGLERSEVAVLPRRCRRQFGENLRSGWGGLCRCM